MESPASVQRVEAFPRTRRLGGHQFPRNPSSSTHFKHSEDHHECRVRSALLGSSPANIVARRLQIVLKPPLLPYWDQRRSSFLGHPQKLPSPATASSCCTASCATSRASCVGQSSAADGTNDGSDTSTGWSTCVLGKRVNSL